MLDYNKITNSFLGNSFVSQVHYYEEIDSTNDFAKHLENGSDVLVCTDFQKAGRGRFDRKWESSKGKNLTFTVRKKIQISPAANQHVNFFFSYFLFEAVSDLLVEFGFNDRAIDLSIKWPNDLIFKNQKIAGVLTESLPVSGKYVIGIGLNVNQKEFRTLGNASSLINMTGMEFDITDVLLKIMNKYSLNYSLLADSKYDLIFEKWMGSTKMIGRKCEFTVSDTSTKHGIISNLNPDGSIELLVENDKLKYLAGDIRLTSF